MWSWTDAIVLVNMESVNFEVYMGLNFWSNFTLACLLNYLKHF